MDLYLRIRETILHFLMSHNRGTDNEDIHGFAWNTFIEITKIAQKEGLYAAGQDLFGRCTFLKCSRSGPAVAELEFEMATAHRPAEAFLMFAAYKCGPGAFNAALSCLRRSYVLCWTYAAFFDTRIYVYNNYYESSWH